MSNLPDGWWTFNPALPTPSPVPLPTVIPLTGGTGTVTTSGTFQINLNNGESFQYQDPLINAHLNFLIDSGTLNATATLNADNAGGTLAVTPTTSGSIFVSSLNVAQIKINNVIATNYTFTAGTPFMIVWTYSIFPVHLGITALYMRSDTYTTNGFSAYGLDRDFTNTAQTITSSIAGAATVAYGYRVFILHSNGATSELTTGTPVAQDTISVPFLGQQSMFWNCPGASLILGYDALELTVYEQQNGGIWTARATYVSPVLISKALEATTWQFLLDVNFTQSGGNTYSSFSFGNFAHKSYIYGVSFTVPLESEIELWRFGRGDWVGFILGGYMDLIGMAFYLFILLGVGASLYVRYQHPGPIIVIFALFGGAGGIIWLLIPPYAAAVVGAIFIIAASFITWRVIR